MTRAGGVRGRMARRGWGGGGEMVSTTMPRDRSSDCACKMNSNLCPTRHRHILPLPPPPRGEGGGVGGGGEIPFAAKAAPRRDAASPAEAGEPGTPGVPGNARVPGVPGCSRDSPGSTPGPRVSTVPEDPRYTRGPRVDRRSPGIPGAAGDVKILPSAEELGRGPKQQSDPTMGTCSGKRFGAKTMLEKTLRVAPRSIF